MSGSNFGRVGDLKCLCKSQKSRIVCLQFLAFLHLTLSFGQAGGEVSGVIWAASAMGIVRDWPQTLPCASKPSTNVLPPTVKWGLKRQQHNTGGLVVGSIKITRHKIDILTTSWSRSFGRLSQKLGPSIKPAAKRGEPRFATDMGRRLGKMNFFATDLGQKIDAIWVLSSNTFPMKIFLISMLLKI